MNLGKALLSSLGSQIVVPTVIGTPFQGGYYAGRMKVAGISYALIISPAAGQFSGDLQWKTTNSSTVGSTSAWDGLANTNAQIAAGASSHPAANFCKNLTIGGYTDWALPARDQLELVYRNFKPIEVSNNTSSGINNSSDPPSSFLYTTTNPGQTPLLNFKAGGADAITGNGALWSSTEASSTTANYQNTGIGLQTTDNKTMGYSVRAVRMIVI